MWQFTPFAAPFVLIGLMCAWAAHVAYRRRAFPGALPFSLLMAAIAGWTWLNAVEKSLTALGPRQFVSTLLYVFILAAPAAWLWFAVRYCGWSRRLPAWASKLLWVEPALVLLLSATDSQHGLFRSRMEMSTDGSYAVMAIAYGPLFWAHVVYTYAIFALGAALVFWRFNRRPQGNRGRRIVLLLGMLAPVLGNAAYVFGLQPQRHVDWTPIYFAVTGLCAFGVLFEIRIFDVLPIARDFVVDRMSDAVLVLDGQGRLLDANRAGRRLLPIRMRAAKGQPVPSLLPTLPFEDARAKLEAEWSCERDSKVYDVCWTILREDDVVVGSVVRLTDVTARKQAELERRRLEDAVRNAQRLESLKVLTGGVAHDFNNLLHAVLGNAELARLQLPPCSPAMRLISNIVHSTQQASNLSNQMLAFTGKRSGTEVPVDLCDLIEQNAELLRAAATRQATFELDLATNLPLVSGDPLQLRQILIHLVMNASEALGDQPGAVCIRTRQASVTAQDLAAAQVFGGIESGVQVMLEVVDSGSGIDPSALPRIFDPFFSTKFAGRGLGLAVVSGIVRSYGGAILVDSTPGGGSSFRVLLPALNRPDAQGTSSPGEASTPRSSAPQRCKATILVADDEECIRELSRRVLSHHGYQVLTAADGGEALFLFRKHEPDVDLVLLDLTMPVLGGAAVYREIFSRRPRLPVVLSSGFDESEALAAFSPDERPMFLGKPYHVADLLELVHRTLLERSVSGDAPRKH
jgi:signal transduction histidine kinase/ActR/RegA family two-component response regulator